MKKLIVIAMMMVVGMVFAQTANVNTKRITIDELIENVANQEAKNIHIQVIEYFNENNREETIDKTGELFDIATIIQMDTFAKTTMQQVNSDGMVVIYFNLANGQSYLIVYDTSGNITYAKNQLI